MAPEDDPFEQHEQDLRVEFAKRDAEIERLRAGIRSHRDQRGDDRCWVDDINGGWTTFDAWEATVVPPIVAGIKRCDGTWEPSHCWEVRRNSA